MLHIIEGVKDMNKEEKRRVVLSTVSLGVSTIAMIASIIALMQ